MVALVRRGDPAALRHPRHRPDPYRRSGDGLELGRDWRGGHPACCPDGMVRAHLPLRCSLDRGRQGALYALCQSRQPVAECPGRAGGPPNRPVSGGDDLDGQPGPGQSLFDVGQRACASGVRPAPAVRGVRFSPGSVISREEQVPGGSNMPLLALPAVFMRGGTSRAVMFHQRDLPEREAWDPIFLAAMGSPDPNGRQLNGMGGGISSLSKICILAPSDRPDADIDYTFAQVQIKEAAIGYRGNCGNMSSAVGPFAVDEGIVRPNGDTAVVRIFNTNTGKIIRSTFGIDDGRAAVDGSLTIPGVAGSGAPIRLDFLSPGGAVTGKLLPTGNAVDRL